VDLYARLGVSKSASEDDIKKAFRKLAQTYHPDKNQGNKANDELFKEITKAFEVLSDKKKRALYDEFGEEGLGLSFNPQAARMRGMRSQGPRAGYSGFSGFSTAPGQDFGDLFTEIFSPPGQAPGGRRPASPFAQQPKYFESESTIDFIAAIQGTEARIVSGTLVWTARIPPGVADGDKLRIKHSSGKVADLILTIRVDTHRLFKRNGQNLYVDMPVTVAEAYYGAQIHVPTPTGGGTLTIPQHTQSGTVMRVAGRGVSRQGKVTGDLYVRWIVVIPMDDSVETRQAIDNMTARMRDPREGLF